MKKFWKQSIVVILCIMMLFSFASCYSGSEQKEVIAMFDSFEKSQDIILLTHFQLIVNDKYYDRSNVQYNGQVCNIVYLEEDGFYSYTYNEEDLTVEFLFALYEGFETTSLGTTVLPSKVDIVFFADDRFWFEIYDDPSDGIDTAYYSWHIDTKQSEFVDDCPKEREFSLDNYRSENYSFSYKTRFLFSSVLDVTDKSTGVTKRIDRKILNTFDEGRQIKKINKTTIFGIDKIFEKNGDLYFLCYFEVGFLGDPCYYYVVKWNFETEECEYYTALFFEEYQEWIDDMYIK